MAIVNVQNRTDNLCFLWSILAGIHPVDRKRNPHWLTLQTSFELTRHNWPLSQWPFETSPNSKNLNTEISVSVLVFEDRQLIPLYLSPHRNRKHSIHLLLLSDGDTQHYTLIKNLPRLVSGRTKCRNKTHVCPYCLHCFAQNQCRKTYHDDLCYNTM